MNPPITATDRGLVRGVGPVALTGAFVGILVGSGIFAIPASMAAAVGPYAVFAYLLCGLAIGAVMLCFAEAASRVPTSGGPYGFATAAFGPFVGFLTGGLNWASAVTGAGAVAAAAAAAIGTIIPAMASGPVRAVVIVAVFFGLATVNIAGVGLAARLTAAATAVKLIPLAVFIVIGAGFIDPANLTLPALSLAAADIAGADIGRAAILGIFLFTGIEATMAVSGEVRDPARTIPRAIIAALLGYAMLCVVVHLVAQGLLGAALAASPAPLADAMAVVSPGLRLLLIAGAALSMLGWLASDALATPRSLFALARGGYLPAILGRVHPRTHTPATACLTHAAIGAGLAISGSFAALAILATLITILVYLVGCAAAVRLRSRDTALAGPPLRVPGLTVCAIGGGAAMLWVGLQSTAAEALAILAYLGLLSLAYRFRRRV